MIELPVIDSRRPNREDSESRIWRSLNDLKGDPSVREARKNEFGPNAAEAPSGASRRQFLQLMGASVALGGLTACRRPEELILPYAIDQADVIPGIPLYYASSMPFRGVHRGILVESHEGRPTKVEGNPQHPVSRGRTSPFEQASILELYDPDRSRQVRRKGAVATYNDFVAFVRQLSAGGGERMVVLADESASPTRAGLRERLQQKYPQLRWITYSPEGDDAEALGMQLAFGRPLRPSYRFSEARVIVSLDADFLSPTERGMLPHTAEFAESRRLGSPEDTMSRLYVVESSYTTTGAKADHRIRLRSSDIPAFAAALAARLGVGAAASFDHPLLAVMAEDLRSAGAGAVMLAGDTQPPEVHALCAAVNGALGSAVAAYLDTGEETRPFMAASVQALAAEMLAGQVDVLLLLNVNPVYSAPGDIDFKTALQRVPVSIHTSLHYDETARVCSWHLPAAHYLEAWGDGRAFDGTVSIVQPLIAPLYPEARSDIELLHTLATGTVAPGYDLVRSRWQALGLIPGDFEEGWRKTLHDGFIPGTAYPVVAAAPAAVAVPPPPADPNAIELVFRLDPTVLDGRFANLAWMQELPDPITKIVWDNVALMSPRTAEALGLEIEYEKGVYVVDRIRIGVEGRTIELPVWILPGHADNSITVNFGYGRDIVSFREHQAFRFWDTDHRTNVYGHGAVATGVGVSVWPLRSSTLQRVLIGINVEKADDEYELVSTQEHWSMEGRPIIRAASLDHFREHPHFAAEAVEPIPSGAPWDEFPALWQEDHPVNEAPFKDSLYYANQWGMVIDLNTCTACQACVVACQAENNIPVVGKEQVGVGREMHWLRIDRYFMGEEEYADEPEMAFQPMLCVQCENAPCEAVCPVYATSHSPDGISEMTYNRCIGTRYCSNNCPYKVRRFNFFHWMKHYPIEASMGLNPDVTVRFRGVMEKCTFCVQRVREVQRQASIENRTLRDGEVQTACQQVCPANAITFGDIANPDSDVAAARRQPRNYAVLEELNTQPRATYLGLVRNTNPRLAPPHAPATLTPET